MAGLREPCLVKILMVKWRVKVSLVVSQRLRNKGFKNLVIISLSERTVIKVQAWNHQRHQGTLAKKDAKDCSELVVAGEPRKIRIIIELKGKRKMAVL